MPPDQATVHILRRDIALQVSRAVRRLGVTQLVAAAQLGVPQPTISKILNGQVDNLSLELLIRLAVRAGLSLTVLTGGIPEEAGAFLSTTNRQPSSGGRRSQVLDEARHLVELTDKRFTPSQRLEAFVEHNQLIEELRRAGQFAQESLAGKGLRA